MAVQGVVPVVGRLVTLVVAGQAYNLLNLLQAANANISGFGCEIDIQAITGNCFIGGADLNTTTNFGVQVVNGAAYKIGAMSWNGTPVANIYVAGSVANATIAVLILSS